MLEREPYEDGWQVKIPVTGVLRLVRLLPAAFLGLWMCGWAAGEYFAAGIVLPVLRDRFAPGVNAAWLPHARFNAVPLPPLAFAFVGLWLVMWTIGGLFAIKTIIELVAGVPILRWNDEHVELVVQVGPFARRKRVRWSDLGPITPGPMRTLVVTGLHGRLPVGPFADDTDAQQLAAWLAEAQQKGAAETPKMVAIG